MIHADCHNSSSDEPRIIFTDMLRARMAWESEVAQVRDKSLNQPHKHKSACPV